MATAPVSSKPNSGFFQPAEWAPHESVWLAWPSHANLWEENLPAAQKEFTDLCKAITDVDASGKAKGESLHILVPNDAARTDAIKALSGLPVQFHAIPFGDIWLRDTAPIFLTNAAGKIAAGKFRFNCWGGKYALPFDDSVSEKISSALHQSSDLPVFAFPFVLEGGSVEVDGEGTCLTSKQCLLNPNRNPEMDQATVEAALCDSLGVQKVLWVNDGLLNDHTDGHIDTIARYVAPGVIACMIANTKDDPNFSVMEEIARDLESFIDAKGRKIKVVRVPSPGAVMDEDRVMPASYLNFYIGNSTVVVPTYGTEYDDAAVAAISKIFPTRKTVGRSALAILSGGGAFHCITQQQPVEKT
jgi:agmatine deiminase